MLHFVTTLPTAPAEAHANMGVATMFRGGSGAEAALKQAVKAKPQDEEVLCVFLTLGVC